MAMYGADVAQLRQLASQFEQKASQLDSDRMTVGNAIQISAWVGPVAVRFRHEWDSAHSRRVHEAAVRLRDAATALRRNADDQEKTSAVGAGAGSTGTASRLGTGDDGISGPDLIEFLTKNLVIDGAGWVSERVDIGGLAVEYLTGKKFDVWKVLPHGSYLSSMLKGIGLGDAAARFSEAMQNRDWSGAMLAAGDGGAGMLPPGLSLVWSGLRDMTGFAIPLDESARDEHFAWLESHYPDEDLGARYTGWQGLVNLGNDNIERKAPWLNRGAEAILEKPAEWLYNMGIRL